MFGFCFAPVNIKINLNVYPSFFVNTIFLSMYKWNISNVSLSIKHHKMYIGLVFLIFRKQNRIINYELFKNRICLIFFYQFIWFRIILFCLIKINLLKSSPFQRKSILQMKIVLNINQEFYQICLGLSFALISGLQHQQKKREIAGCVVLLHRNSVHHVGENKRNRSHIFPWQTEKDQCPSDKKDC